MVYSTHFATLLVDIIGGGDIPSNHSMGAVIGREAVIGRRPLLFLAHSLGRPLLERSCYLREDHYYRIYGMLPGLQCLAHWESAGLMHLKHLKYSTMIVVSTSDRISYLWLCVFLHNYVVYKKDNRHASKRGFIFLLWTFWNFYYSVVWGLWLRVQFRASVKVQSVSKCQGSVSN